MIDIIKQTPKVFSEQSRDYQVIARLYSAILNISKLYTDDLNAWDGDIDNKLALLRAKTLNFQPKRVWDLDDLEAITSCFKYLVKNKGTKKALEYCINILMKIEHISGTVDSTTVTISDNNVVMRMEYELATLGIVEDLVKYILPSGLTYRIIYQASSKSGDVNIEVKLKKDEIKSNTIEYSEKMFIGDNKDTKRYFDETFVYDDKTFE